MKKAIILDLCGGTGSWSKPYAKAGYDVRIIDPQVWLEDDYGTGDVRLFKKPNETIRGILAAPPCTHFSSSGARWWKQKGKKPLLEGLSVVDACLRIIYATQPKWWVMENPVGRLRHYIGKPKCTFQPYEYGDAYSKRTCLWGNFNMPKPTNIVKPKMIEGVAKDGRVKRESVINRQTLQMSANERARVRSITPKGFVNAFYKENK